MELLNRYKKMPYIVQVVIGSILPICFVGIVSKILILYSFSEILGVLAFILLIFSMSQHNIIKLRLYGACAGVCFVIQFAMSDLPLINVIGQTGLVIYGIYQAYIESKANK